MMYLFNEYVTETELQKTALGREVLKWRRIRGRQEVRREAKERRDAAQRAKGPGERERMRNLRRSLIERSPLEPFIKREREKDCGRLSWEGCATSWSAARLKRRARKDRRFLVILTAAREIAAGACLKAKAERAAKVTA